MNRSVDWQVQRRGSGRPATLENAYRKISRARFERDAQHGRRRLALRYAGPEEHGKSAPGLGCRGEALQLGIGWPRQPRKQRVAASRA
jgi:hypothetical protein